MNRPTEPIPGATIEAIARSLFKETTRYGFKQVDYLRFVNFLLDMTMKNSSYSEENENTDVVYNQHQNLTLPLTGERIKIREFAEDTDRTCLERWINDSEGRHFLISRITAKELNIDQFIRSKDNILGLICSNDEGETPIGIMAFLDHDNVQRKAELRKLIGEPEYRGKGFAKEATELWIQFGISALRLKKIYLNTLETNIRNIKLNEELGFRVEGILRNEFFLNNQYYDVLKMSYLIE